MCNSLTPPTADWACSVLTDPAFAETAAVFRREAGLEDAPAQVNTHTRARTRTRTRTRTYTHAHICIHTTPNRALRLAEGRNGQQSVNHSRAEPYGGTLKHTRVRFRNLHPLTQAEGRERGLLVKKWTSVVRLSKQLQDLKAKLAAAESSSYSKHWAGAARTEKVWVRA